MVEFRCEKCGKLLRAEVQAGRRVRCCHCGESFSPPSPSVLKALDRKGVVASAPLGQPEAPVKPDSDIPASAKAPVHGRSNGRLGWARRWFGATPWALSLALHGVLGVVLVFTVVVVTGQSDRMVIYPDARLSDRPGGALEASMAEPSLEASAVAVAEPFWAEPVEQAPTLEPALEASVELLDAGGAGAPDATLLSGPRPDGPRSEFLGAGGNAHHVVFVVDRSGSMLDTLDTVKLEMLRSIAALEPAQDFHVIFFNNGEPLEAPARRLVPVTEASRRTAGAFLAGVIAQNDRQIRSLTDPRSALQRAFEVLSQADTRHGRPGKLIYLLTDGEFANDGAVERLLAELNAERTVHINTYLFLFLQDGPGGTPNVLERIAEAHGGAYRFISELD